MSNHPGKKLVSVFHLNIPELTKMVGEEMAYSMAFPTEITIKQSRTSLQHGFYEHAVDIYVDGSLKGDDAAEEAWKISNIEALYHGNRDIVPIKRNGLRSSIVGDIFKVDGVNYVCNVGGWLKL